MHADAYAGYDAPTAAKGGKPPAITHVTCMAQARRELFKVYDSTKSPIAEEALRRIGELYAIEAVIKGQSPEQRCVARQAQSKRKHPVNPAPFLATEQTPLLAEPALRRVRRR
ncbi:IS66 family transposase [Dankookia rubra]|uniref:IS66 family transposase n=1 Tax=Dankookia rubra TaxID=1442381 RepID=UPI001F4F2AEB|nr:transposase [Dankookia rubra]